MADIILSLKPRYVDLIFGGTKGFEYRRVRPNLERGDDVVIYASSPVSAVVGYFSVSEMLEATPRELWEQSHEHAGLSRNEFEKYFAEALAGVAIRVDHCCHFDEPLPLSRLREMYEGFHPPQSFRYVETLPDGGEKLLAHLSVLKMSEADS